MLNSCAEYQIDKSKYTKVKKFHSSSGFALVYNDNLFQNGEINKKLDNKQIVIMHSFLKPNTPVKILNPDNGIEVEAKVYRRAEYSKLFNVVLSKKVADLLMIDNNNPYVEILEIKKNKTFIAKKSNTFEEEKKVFDTAPVNDIQINVINETSSKKEIKSEKKINFIILISDFYYLNSATNLKKELLKKTQINKLKIEKINENKFRLFVGPFKNFESLKSSYISLNNLGFDELSVYKE